MARILIVEDDPGLARSLVQGLGEAGHEVEVAGSVSAASARLGTGRWDLLLLDLGLPDGDGFDLLDRVRGLPDAPPALITTARGELDARLRGLEGGAEDYLVKPYAFAELLARIRVLLRRRGPAVPVAMRVADLEVDPVARRARRAGQVLELTPLEFDLLAQLVVAQGAVVTREMLAREVWRAREWTPSMDNVIDVHVSRLRSKLDGGAERPLLRTVRGVGFVLADAP